MPYFQNKKVGDLPPGNFGKRRIQGAERLSQEKMRLHKHRSMNKWRILELSMSETWLALRCWFLQPPWLLWGYSKTWGTPNGNSSRSQLHFTSQLHQTSFGGLFNSFLRGEMHPLDGEPSESLSGPWLQPLPPPWAPPSQWQCHCQNGPTSVELL